MTTARQRPQHLRGTYATGIASALLLPFASILAIRRRRLTGNTASLRLLGVVFVFAAAAGLIAGCSSSSPAPVPGTPAGQSTVVITATSGSISQKTSIALTVQ